MDKRNYEMRYPKRFFSTGIISAAVLLAVFILASVGGEELGTIGIILLALTLVFALLCVCLILYMAKWKINVEGDALTIHALFCPVRTIKFLDITMIEKNPNGISGYIDGKKIFTADTRMANYSLFIKQLQQAGKMDAILKKGSFAVSPNKVNPKIKQLHETGETEAALKKDNFTVKPNKADLVEGISGVLLFGGWLVLTIFWQPYETMNWVLWLGILGLAFAIQYLLARTLYWEIAVTQDTLFFRKAFGLEKAYPIGEITKTEERGGNFLLYAGEEEIAKMPIDNNGLPVLLFLLERLAAENVPFYNEGQLY